MTPHGSISRLSRLLQALDGWLAAYVRKADFPLTNLFFSPSLLKQRIRMLQKPASSRWKLLRYAAVLPLGAVLWMCTQDAIDPPAAAKLKPYVPAEDVFTVVEQQPEFPGGSEALYRFITENMRYPEPALRAEVEGKVFVSFVIRKNGKVTDVKILKGMGFGTDEETMRVMNTLPNWKPGYQNGKPVDVQYNIPVDFTLPKKTAQADKQASVVEENDEMDPTFYEDIRRKYKTFLVNGKSVSFDEYVRLDKYSYAGYFDLKTKTVSISVKLPNK